VVDVSQSVSSARLARLGVLAAVSSRLFSRLVGILFVAVLAHRSSESTVAVYGYLLGTATLVATLTDLGVAGIAGREVAAGRLPADGALAAALPAQAVSILAACAITAGLAWVGGPAQLTITPVLLTLAFVAVNGMVNLWSELLRGQSRVLLEAAIQTLTSVMLVVGGLVVVDRGGNASDLLAVVAAKEVVGIVICWLALRPHRRPDVIRLRQLARQSVYLAVAGTAVVILWREGTILVGAFGSFAALASYVVASRFLDAGVTMASTIGFGLLPGASAASSDPVAFNHIARRYLSLVTVVGLVVAVLGFTLASPVTLTVFGNRWHDAIPAVRAISIAVAPIMIGYAAWFLLLACDQQRWLAVSATVGVVVASAVTGFWMIVGSAPLAAAGGTAAGAGVMMVLLLTRLARVLRGEPGQTRSTARHRVPALSAAEINTLANEIE
jgi:O-antigen/teichoic acid export membrane protein